MSLSVYMYTSLFLSNLCHFIYSRLFTLYFVPYKFKLAPMYSISCPLENMFFIVGLKEGKDTQTVTKKPVTDELKRSTREDLFGFITENVADFIKEHNITRKLPLGFTFSFPVRQTSLISGTLIRWTKGYNVSGVVEEDVVKLLQAAFQSRGVSFMHLSYGLVYFQ